MNPLTQGLVRQGDQPLYQQIHAHLHRQIADGKYVQGDELPTEKELAETFGVSTFTCKRAFDSLAADGLIDRGRGKRTRVARSSPQRVNFGGTLGGLTERTLLEAWNIEVSLQDCRFMPAPDGVAQELGLEIGDTIRRTKTVGRRRGSLSGHVTTYVPEDIGRMFSIEDLSSTPLFVLILRQGQIRIDRADQTMSACPLPEELAEALEAEPGTPVFKRIATVYDDKGRAIEHFEALSLWDQFSYRMVLTNSGTR